MLNITSEAIDWLTRVRPVWEAIAKQDKNLARQLRDSASSVVGNLGEGENRRGGHQRERFETAYGSAGEARVWLLAAAGLAYVSQETVAPLADWADKARAVTWKMMR